MQDTTTTTRKKIHTTATTQPQHKIVFAKMQGAAKVLDTMFPPLGCQFRPGIRGRKINQTIHTP